MGHLRLAGGSSHTTLTTSQGSVSVPFLTGTLCCPVSSRGGYALRDSCLENPLGRGAWWVTAHPAAKSLSDWQLHFAPFSSRGSTLASEHWLASPPLPPPLTQLPTRRPHLDPARLPLRPLPQLVPQPAGLTVSEPGAAETTAPENLPTGPSVSHGTVGVRA